MSRALDIVILGLSLSSSWGNGHATTFRSLIRGLHAEGHHVLFLERDVTWYATHRDLSDADFCELSYYDSMDELRSRFERRLTAADAVIIGSYVPDGVAVIDMVAALKPRLLCFYDIDTPVTLAKLGQGDQEYIAARQMPLFDLYLSFSGGGVLDRLVAEFGVSRAEALYCSVDERLYRNTGEETFWDLGYLGTYSPDRQEKLQKLLIEPARQLPHMRFIVAGPQFPADIDWPENVTRIEHLAPADHASFYSRQRFTLNITRSDMIEAGWSPSVRLFEAAACGTPIISDFWRGLNELFPQDRSILIAHDTADVVGALADLSEEERRGMADLAQRIVHGDHTGRARARQLVSILAEGPQQNQVGQRALA
ncbi:glycosyl transferase [Rhizobium dioscoreae]|uniref:CgeB family protein n=1 Tax=Rhizobium dioscoreae TaxID=2653122 RepID=UPI001260A324|nr:glycosyltransferase [Rhizobium dioscoreae]GES41353.1 glycosyl transferase [Rhizobium dioscoreae]